MIEEIEGFYEEEDKSLDFLYEDLIFEEIDEETLIEDDIRAAEEGMNIEAIVMDITKPQFCYSNEHLYPDPELYEGKKDDELTHRQRFMRLYNTLPARIRNSNKDFDFERFGYTEDQVKDSKPIRKFSAVVRKIYLADYDVPEGGITATVFTLVKHKSYYCYAAINIGENVIFFRETLDRRNMFITSTSIPVEVIYMYKQFHEANIASTFDKWALRKLLKTSLNRYVKKVKGLGPIGYERPALTQHPTDLHMLAALEDDDENDEYIDVDDDENYIDLDDD